MLEIVGRYWWTIALRGLVAVIFGVLSLALPRVTVVVLVVIFGAWAFLDGVLSLSTGLAARRRGGRWGALVFTGLLGIAAGLVAWVSPTMTAKALFLLIAIWAILFGLLLLFTALLFLAVPVIGVVLGLAGAALLLLGILLFVSPMGGAVAVAWLVGLFALVVGALLIFTGFAIRAFAGRVVVTRDR
ncbi:MAG TPA: DUF308 domain-containing protein [Vulgatibacter sp.]|nr:DUF308 domain-containing protein [Vulgatibacter sp.]